MPKTFSKKFFEKLIKAECEDIYLDRPVNGILGGKIVIRFEDHKKIRICLTSTDEKTVYATLGPINIVNGNEEIKLEGIEFFLPIELR